MTEISCPVCSSECTGPLFEYSVERSASHFCPITRDKDRHQRLLGAIGKLWKEDSCQIFRCLNCRFAFGVPFVGGDEAFYSILHEQQGYPSNKWEYDWTIQNVLQDIEAGKILDIGTGQGLFLQKLEGWGLFATEGSETTRKHLKDKGITVFQSLSDIPPELDSTFQVLSSFQSLEHICDFREVLTQCQRLIAPRGRLVISVPDCDAMIRQERLTGCPDMPPNHISKWTSKSLTLALEQSGFAVEQKEQEQSSLRNLLNATYLKLLSKAANQDSLAAQVYKIKNKKLRAPLLRLVGIPYLLTLLPYAPALLKGGSFIVSARKKV